MNAQEATRRQSNTARLEALFRARPSVWIYATELEEAGGRQAWRTRVSDLRKRLEKAGEGTIQNVMRRESGRVVASYYRFLPHVPLGRDASVPAPDRWPALGGPMQEPWGLTPPEAR